MSTEALPLPAGRPAATLVGLSAIAMWSTLALLTTAAGALPPFQLTAMAFTVATLLVSLKWALARQNPLTFLRQPAVVWLLGVGGLFGFHSFYFLALRLAPPVEASLIAYLWPLLIVVFSGFLPGERLGVRQVAGALLGLLGCGLLVARGGGLSFDPRFMAGYASAVACAVTWAGYSVLSRQFGQVPTDTVGGFCGVVAGLALICHLLFEQTVWPVGAQWLAVLGLGFGPVGAAFFAWDHGVKHGDIRLLGVLSYAAPLLSTLLLVAFGRAPATPVLLAACALIIGGAVVAVPSSVGR